MAPKKEKNRKRIERNISFDISREVFYVTLYFGVSAPGKGIKKFKTAKTLKEARRILLTHEYEVMQKPLVMPATTTVGEMLDQWLDTVKLDIARTTRYGYQSIINKHIKPAFGTVELQSLTPQRIQHYYAEKMKYLSPNSIKKHHNLLMDACSEAVRQDIMRTNPVEKVRPPRVIRREIECCTAEQVALLIEAARGTPIEFFVLLAAYCGLRRGEILGLKWQDIDFQENTMTIRHTRTKAGGEIINKEPKTPSSWRILSIPEELKSLLLPEFERQRSKARELWGEYNKEGYVIIKSDGNPPSPNNMTMLVRELAKKCNLPRTSPHKLRHSFASIANSQGMTAYDISKALGHSSTTTTTSIYMHLLTNANTATMQAVAGAISPAARKEEAAQDTTPKTKSGLLNNVVSF